MGAGGSISPACASGHVCGAPSALGASRKAGSQGGPSRTVPPSCDASGLPLHADDPPPLPPTPPPLPVTAGALEALATKAGHAFGAALLKFAKDEQRRWLEERKTLEERTEQLEELKLKLRNERANFEEERRRFAKEGGSERSEVVQLNVGGEAHVAVSRATLTVCQDSLLAASFSGRWAELPTDDEGRVLVDFSPGLFLPLVDYLRARRREESGSDMVATPPGPFEDPVQDAHFLDMLRYYKLLDWVYKQPPVRHKIMIGDFNYSVLPPEDPSTARLVTDMRNVEVTVPRGWEIVDSSAMYFELIIRELTHHSWGAPVLLVRSADSALSSACASALASPTPLRRSGRAAKDTVTFSPASPRQLKMSTSKGTGGFSPVPRSPATRTCPGATAGGFVGYRTRLSTSGAPGSRYTDPSKWFQSISEDGRVFKLAGSGFRIVIRAKANKTQDPSSSFKVFS